MAAKTNNGATYTVVNTGTNRSITGGNGVDTIDAATLFTSGGATYKISGGNGADVVNGSNFNEIIWGDDDSDTSANGADTLNGGGGDDQIHGGNGADRIAGDAGADLLWGDRGGDTFVYKLQSDSSASGGAWSATTGDTIQDFTSGDDKIDLSALNAFLTGPGPSRLLWNGSTATAHGVWTSGGFVFADLNGDATAEVAIKVVGAVGAMDFVGVNHRPTGVNESLAATEDGQFAGTVANEVDPDGDPLSYALVGAPPAGFALAANGGYTFDAGVAAYQALAAGQTTTLSIPYTISDPFGGTATATLTIVVTGTNDAPVATATVAAVIEDMTTAGTLAASDVDSDAATTFAIDGTVPVGFVLTNAATGAWTFDASSYDSLAQGETLPLTIAFTATDSHGAASSSTLTITITGTNDAPTVVAALSATVSEDDAPLTLDLLTGASDVDHGSIIHAGNFAVASGNGAGLSLVGDSVVVNTAAYQYLQTGSSEVVTVTYAVTDQFGASAAQSATITITGVNDRPVTTDDVAATTENLIVATDVLSNDSDVDDANATLRIGISNTRGAHGLGYASPGSAAVNGLSVAADGRSLAFDPNGYTDPVSGVTGFDYLGAGQTATVLIDYNAVDPHGANSHDGSPAYSTLVVTITGTNDVPVITSAAQAGSVVEDGTLTASGVVTASDADQNATASFTGSAIGAYGAFTVGAGGAWNYALDNAAHQNLAQGESHVETFTVTVTDDQGATATQSVTITVTGANDAPTAAADVKSATEDDVVGGSVAGNDGDVDTGAVLTYALAAPVAGLTLNANGSYSFDAGNAAYQSLGAGVTTTVIANYTVTDEHLASASSTLTITVTGVNDAAVIGGVATGSVTEDGTLIASGALTISDADAGQASFQAATLAGTYGSFAVTTAGVWTYTLNNADPDLNTLNAGQQAPETFTVLALDGTAKLVTVTVNGANEGPTLPTAYTGPIADPNDFDGFTGGSLYTTVGAPAINGNNLLRGTAGNDTINGQSGNDTIYGLAGNDTINGDSDIDTIYGGSGDDILSGGQATDTIYGGSGRDVITGDQNSDVLIGGYGADVLTGNQGPNTFRYLSVRDTNDTITDFSGAQGDKIDVAALGFSGVAHANAFTAAHQLIWFTDGANTVILGDTDGNLATAEFMITLSNGAALSATDFIL